MNKTALITGASGGIGYEITKLFAKDGKDLILVARSEDKLKEIKIILKKYGVKVNCFTKDLAKENATKELFDEITENEFQVEYLVNNAGFGDNGAFVNSDFSKQSNMVKLNILALTELCHLFGAEMQKRKSGRILNIASMAAFCAGPYMSVYFASKAYVLSFSEALAEELKKDGVSVTCLCPGPTETNFAKEADCGEAKMFKLLPVAKAKDVAECGYKAMMKGKAHMYHGFTVKGFFLLTKLSPRMFNAKTTSFFTHRK